MLFLSVPRMCQCGVAYEGTLEYVLTGCMWMSDPFATISMGKALGTSEDSCLLNRP